MLAKIKLYTLPELKTTFGESSDAVVKARRYMTFMTQARNDGAFDLLSGIDYLFTKTGDIVDCKSIQGY
tara:strand:+ start:1778 stop:1984 length:207 start_codon:yes stop_codon:yes gene_type:complete